MRRFAWVVVGIAACAAPAKVKPAPAAPVPAPAPAPVASAEPPVEPVPEPDPPLPPPPMPTFAGSSAGAFDSAAPAQLGADASKPVNGETYVVRLQRTPCFGDCPEYAVELYADGKVIYSGAKTGKLPPADIAKLAKHLFDAGFFRLTWNEPCKYRFTDQPGAIVTLVRAGRKRTIKDDHGNMCIPSLVRTLENDIDHVAEKTAWSTP